MNNGFELALSTTVWCINVKGGLNFFVRRTGERVQVHFHDLVKQCLGQRLCRRQDALCAGLLTVGFDVNGIRVN